MHWSGNENLLRFFAVLVYYCMPKLYVAVLERSNLGLDWEVGALEKLGFAASTGTRKHIRNGRSLKVRCLEEEVRLSNGGEFGGS